MTDLIPIMTVPANEASWQDLQTVFGRSDARRCQCQRYKLRSRESLSRSRSKSVPIG